MVTTSPFLRHWKIWSTWSISWVRQLLCLLKPCWLLLRSLSSSRWDTMWFLITLGGLDKMWGDRNRTIVGRVRLVTAWCSECRSQNEGEKFCLCCLLCFSESSSSRGWTLNSCLRAGDMTRGAWLQQEDSLCARAGFELNWIYWLSLQSLFCLILVLYFHLVFWNTLHFFTCTWNRTGPGFLWILHFWYKCQTLKSSASG